MCAVVQPGSPFPILINDGPQVDAFSRLRISNPQVLFDSKQIVDNQPLYYDDQQTSGSGTTSVFQTNQASTKMSVSNLTAGTRVRQTFQRFNYQPGTSSLINLTGVLGSKNTGIQKRLGYFDGYNGLFFELNATDLRVVVRTSTSGSTVDGYVIQANWNLDKLDGTGASGITLDTAKTQIFVIDFEWLGVGRVRFGFNIAGITYYCHQVLNANILTLAFMGNSNLPLRFEISNDGTGPIDSLTKICSTVINEGGLSISTGTLFSIDGYASSLTTNANISVYPIIAIQLKSNYYMATIDPVALNIISSTTANFRICLLVNPTIIGTALSYTGVNNSAIQYALGTSGTTVSGGTQIYSEYGSGSNQAGGTFGRITSSIVNALHIGSNIAGTSDTLVFGVQSVAGGAMTFYGSLSYREKV